MRKLLNTVFVTTEDAYLTLDGENVVAMQKDVVLARYPLHTLSDIVTFTYAGASPSLMGACMERKINLCFCTPNGRFLARACGANNGSVLLRRTQYRFADDESKSMPIACNMILGKLHNARWSIERTLRDHRLRINEMKLTDASQFLKGSMAKAKEASDAAMLRGVEGEAAKMYFSALDEMILCNKDSFFFAERSRRPPRDRLNALLSFAYTLLANECASACESVGLDSYVGFFHTDRPGRASLALDLMEELRPCVADRFVITLINNRIIKPSDLQQRESGAVLLTKDARKAVLQAWQARKREVIVHPFLKEKLPWGLVPYMQALLLARFLRGDIEGYPPFLWK